MIVKVRVIPNALDNEVVSRLETLQAAGAPIETPQHQRRIHGHRIETVRRDADELAIVRIARGDDRHAGRKIAERVPELAQVERFRLLG